MNSKILIRPTDQQDYEQWSRLYYGYAEFYKAPMNGEILGTLWGWIHDPDHEVNGLLAVSVSEDGAETACGLAHVRRMPSPLRGTYVGFLDDLFVDPTFRGRDIGKKLFDVLAEHGKQQSWPIIRWITADDNYRARGLYDQLSNKTMWNTYQMDL